MASNRFEKNVACPTCGGQAQVAYYPHEVDEQASPGPAKVDRFTCPQGCEPGELELTAHIP